MVAAWRRKWWRKDSSEPKPARSAIRLAKLGRPVKIMAGGITGWLDEGFSLVNSGS